MNILAFKSYLSRIHGEISDNDWELVKPLAKINYYLKNQVIQYPKQPCNYLWLVLTGSIKCFQLEHENERILNFFLENEYFSDIKSLFTQTKSNIGFKAAETCSVISIDYPSVIRLNNESAYFQKIGRGILAQHVVMNLTRKKVKFRTGKERYHELQIERPEIFQRFSLKDIANYLNIKPETLSRIRSRK